MSKSGNHEVVCEVCRCFRRWTHHCISPLPFFFLCVSLLYCKSGFFDSYCFFAFVFGFFENPQTLKWLDIRIFGMFSKHRRQLIPISVRLLAEFIHKVRVLRISQHVIRRRILVLRMILMWFFHSFELRF